MEEGWVEFGWGHEERGQTQGDMEEIRGAGNESPRLGMRRYRGSQTKNPEFSVKPILSRHDLFSRHSCQQLWSRHYRHTLIVTALLSRHRCHSIVYIQCLIVTLWVSGRSCHPTLWYYSCHVVNVTPYCDIIVVTFLIFRHAPPPPSLKGGRDISDVPPPPCLEYLGCRFDPTFLYLISWYST